MEAPTTWVGQFTTLLGDWRQEAPKKESNEKKQVPLSSAVHLADETQKVIAKLGNVLKSTYFLHELPQKRDQTCFLEATNTLRDRISQVNSDLIKLNSLLLLGCPEVPEDSSISFSSKAPRAGRVPEERADKNLQLYFENHEKYESIRAVLHKEVFKVQLFIAALASSFFSEKISFYEQGGQEFFDRHKRNIQNLFFKDKKIVPVDTTSEAFILELKKLDPLMNEFFKNQEKEAAKSTGVKIARKITRTPRFWNRLATMLIAAAIGAGLLLRRAKLI